MGKRKHKTAQRSDSISGLSAAEVRKLLPKQRRLEKELRGLAIIIGLTVSLLGFIAYISINPSTATTSSPRSDLITGGLPESAQTAQQVLLQTGSPVYAAYDIDFSATDLKKISLNTSDENLFVISRHQTGIQPESTITLNNQSFFARPLSESVASHSVAAAFEVTDTSGQKLAILQDSGNLVFRRGNDVNLQTRVFRQDAHSAAGKPTTFYAQVKNLGTDPADNLELELHIPEYATLSRLGRNNLFNTALFSSDEHSLTIDSNVSLGGGSETWWEFDVVQSGNIAANANICPNLRATSDQHSDLFSDTQCALG